MAFERFWHKSYAPGVPYEVEFDRTTMPQALRRSAKRFPVYPALIYFGKIITYRELDGLVDRFSKALIGIGIGPGDKVAMIMPNVPQMTVAIYACYRIGAVAVPTNPLYTERELEYQLNNAGAKAAVVLDLLEPRMSAVRPKTGVGPVIYCHINDYLPFPKKQIFPIAKKTMYRKVLPGDRVHEFMDLMEKYSAGGVEDKSKWDGLAALLYTGGTTGVSKGVMINHSHFSCNAQQFKAYMPAFRDGEERVLSIYPYFHSAGNFMLNSMIWCGWTAVLVPRPETDIIVELFGKYQPTGMVGVPTIYTGLLNNKNFCTLDFSKIKLFAAGAAPLLKDTIDRLRALTGATILNTYGLTEATCLVAANPYGGTVVPGTIGLPIPGTDARIVDVETGKKEMPVGESGELVVRAPQVMIGYYKNQDETAQVLHDGWLYTGDIGVFDKEGNITIVDRKKDMIIASGFNIFPNEIDDILFSHPKILEACTIGVPDDYRGETVKAYVVVRPGENLTEQEVVDFCKVRLTAYKVPKKVSFIEAIPKSAVGKILRRAMKDLDRELEKKRK